MARKAAQKKEVNNDGKELFEALKLLEAEKGIPVDFMIDKIKKAIATACKNSYGNEDVVIDMDPESGKFDVFLRKEIVEEVENPNREIALEIVKQYDPRGDWRLCTPPSRYKTVWPCGSADRKKHHPSGHP